MNPTVETGIISISDNDFNNIFNDLTTVTEETPEKTTEESVTTQESAFPIQPTTIDSLDESAFSLLTEPTDETTEDAVENTTEKPTTSDSTSVLQNIYEFGVQNGLFDDFEDRDTFEWTNENFGELFQKQTQKKVQENVEAIIEETGEIGKAIIDYVLEGGNPDDIIDLFKEQKQLADYDLSTDDNKKLFIQNYYTNVTNLKPEIIKTLIQNFELEGTLDTEVNDIKQAYTDLYKQQQLELQQHQSRQREQQYQQEQQFVVSMQQEINKRTDLTEKEKRKIAEAVLVKNQQLEDGQLVNKFYTSLTDIQNDPAAYLDLVHFVTDKENYLAKITTKEKNNTTEKQFNFIKRNNSISKKTGSTITPEPEKQSTFKFF